MTRAELLAVLAQKEDEDSVAWDAVIAIEVATGNLQHLQKRQIAGANQYETAIKMLGFNPPDVILAQQALEGAFAVEQARGGGTAATEALAALTEFIATPPVLDADFTEAADTAEGTGEVL